MAWKPGTKMRLLVRSYLSSSVTWFSAIARLPGQCALATIRALGSVNTYSPRRRGSNAKDRGGLAIARGSRAEREVSAPLRQAHFGALQHRLQGRCRRADWTHARCGWPNHRPCFTTACQFRDPKFQPMDAYATRREGDALTHRQALLIVLGVLLPTFMGSLDQTILATALPTIGRDFDDMHSLPWLMTAYLLVSTAVIPLYGKIADIHGRRFTLRIAIATYMVGSLVCALAPNMLVLIFGRVLHGLGGGGLSSMGMIVLGDLVSPKERGRYYGY